MWFSGYLVRALLTWFGGLTVSDQIALLSGASNIAVTMGLLYFAGRQVTLQEKRDAEEAKRDDAQAAREVKRDMENDQRHREQQEQERELAFRTVHAESFRLFQLSDRLESVDLLEYSLQGLLDPQELRIVNPAEIIGMLAKLGRAAAYVGTTAPTLSNDAAVLAASYNNLALRILHLQTGSREIKNIEYAIRVIKENDQGQLATKRAALIKAVKQAGLLLEDAVMQWEGASIPKALKFSEFAVQSDMARLLAAQFTEPSPDAPAK